MRWFARPLSAVVMLSLLAACSMGNPSSLSQTAGEAAVAAPSNIERAAVTAEAAVVPATPTATSVPTATPAPATPTTPAPTIEPTGTPEPTTTSVPTPEPTEAEGVQPPAAAASDALLEVPGDEQTTAAQVAAGTEAPEFELHSLDGKQIRLRDFRGRPVMLSFFATTCAPCKEELRLLKQLQAQYADELVVLLVGVFEDPETVTPYAQELGIKHMPILLDGFAEATMEYNVMTIPSTIFINREGRIAVSEFGAVGRSRLEVGLAKIGLGTMPDVDSASDPGATGIPVEGCALGDC